MIQKLESFIKNSKLIENCVNDDMDLFNEIKKSRATKSDNTTRIDGSTDIPNVFGKVYSDLFNKIDDSANIKQLWKELNENINEDSWKEIRKIDRGIIKKALRKIKSGKSDPIWDYSSDFFKNAPDILYDNLAAIMQSFLIHGHVSDIILLATLVPLVKDKVANLSMSKITDL